MELALDTPLPASEKRLNLFERYLTVWVTLCMVGGVLLGQSFPGVVSLLRSWEFGEGSHINVPIAILIWLMIIPMMMKVDLSSLRDVGRRPSGLLITLFVNWLVKPFSMAFLAWVFFRSVLPRLISTLLDASFYRQRPVRQWCSCGVI
jgi:ACR3 family arsenite transporter